MKSAATNAITIEEKIKAKALRLGFSLCGITTPEPPSHFGIYEHWLEQSNHADMDYLASSRHVEFRKDPNMLMPGIKSILSLAWSYPIRPVNSLHETRSGWIAGYADGKDYHSWLPKKLKALTIFIEQEVEQSIVAGTYSDSAPILEREIASRAGLGWIGKNSCVISPEIGSTFLLGKIFLDYPLTTDSPFLKDLCGTCKKCIEACPTGCILPNRTIDSRRCLSYQTIENRGSIPQELRKLTGNWLFGCDICQMVCPWNQKASSRISSTRLFNYSINEVLDLLALSLEEYKTRFGGSAISRTKWKGLMRNILVFLGNSGVEDAKNQIQQFLNWNSDQDLLDTAIWAFHQIENANK